MLEKNICFGRIPTLFISQGKNQYAVLSFGNSILINLAQMCMHKTIIDFMIPLALWRDKKIGHRLNSYNFIEKEEFSIIILCSKTILRFTQPTFIEYLTQSENTLRPGVTTRIDVE